MVWCRLTRLDPEHIGAAIMSRLQGGAWHTATQLTIARNTFDADGTMMTTTFRGIDAVSLIKTEPILDDQGLQVVPAYPSGSKLLLDRLLSLHYLDAQDKSWVTLDQFFRFSRPSSMSFVDYVQEWDRLFEDAQLYGGLTISAVGKTWLFFSHAGLTDKELADLKLKVDGDLTRFEDMVGLQLKLAKSEAATTDQREGYKRFSNHHGDGNGDGPPADGSWVTDGDYGWVY